MLIKSILMVFIIALSTSAQAFDPFSMAKVISSAGGSFGSVMGGIDAISEVTDTADAFSDLYSEFNSDGRVSENGQRLISKIQEVENLYTDLDQSGSEIQESAADLSTARRLADALRGVTRAVRAAKRIKNAISSLDKKAKNAQIESVGIEKEQLMVQYEQLYLMKIEELDRVKTELQEKINKSKSSKAILSDLQKKGAKVIGPKGLLKFPSTKAIIEDAIKISERLRPILLGMMLFVVLARIIFYQYSFKSTKSYFDIIRDIAVCTFLLSIYPEMIRAIHTLTSSLSHDFIFGRLEGVRPIGVNYDDLIKDASIGSSSSYKSFLTYKIQYFFTFFKWAIYTIAEFSFKYLMMIMVVFTPIVIFMSEMFNFSMCWKYFMLGMISINLWPIAWNAFGFLVESSSVREGFFSSILETTVAMVVQLMSPIIIYYLSKAGAHGATNIAEGGISRVQSAGSAALSMASPVYQMANKGIETIKSLRPVETPEASMTDNFLSKTNDLIRTPKDQSKESDKSS